ncbi:hypothetical protein RFI_00919 [Reticulomyxa filosa]|uniref:Uncharacterized protein n=1 Tax=Reticulomyxa filosa TaxID=46433 RepID=X6PC97_RETFI|nr:hypothetical protein RFI_00919 [Reticulomyxa filosa]|eukprot:ETO36145.1 hypothetical protein RFI_00919 [Reticulomyxa filosa]
MNTQTTLVTTTLLEKFNYTEWPKLDSKLFCGPRKKIRIPTETEFFGNEKNRRGSISLSQPGVSGNEITHEENKTAHDSSGRVIITKTDENSNNPFNFDRITFHLWLYLFLRTIQPSGQSQPQSQTQVQPSSSVAPTTDITLSIAEEKEMYPDPIIGDDTKLDVRFPLDDVHLIIKVINQMINESAGLPDTWVFVELIEAMGRCGLGHLLLKLCYVDNFKIFFFNVYTYLKIK